MQKEIQKQRAMSLREMKKLMDDQIRQMNNQRFAKVTDILILAS